MKRATFTRRNIAGEPLREVEGWETKIHGVRVVVNRIPNGALWECCEPRTGMTISGRTATTRDVVVRLTVEAVERAAATHHKAPGEWFDGLIAEYQRRASYGNAGMI